MNQARTLLHEKKYKQVIEVLNSIIDENKQSVIAYKLLGKIYAVLGELKKAETELIHAIELDDSSHESYYNLGIVKYFLKEYKQAAGCFNKVKNFYGDYKKTEKYLANIETLLKK